jgi:hypothetical protein
VSVQSDLLGRKLTASHGYANFQSYSSNTFGLLDQSDDAQESYSQYGNRTSTASCIASYDLFKVFVSEMGECKRFKQQVISYWR